MELCNCSIPQDKPLTILGKLLISLRKRNLNTEGETPDISLINEDIMDRINMSFQLLRSSLLN